MRVGILTREFPPEVYGGAGVHVEYLARELARTVEVAVHCFGEPRQSALVAGAYQPWEALAGPEPSSAALEAMSVDLAMAARLGGVDVVHSHTWYANLAGHLAKLLWDVPHVVTTHSLEPLRPWKAEQLGGGYALSSFCERTALEPADAVIAVSAQMRADVIACYPAVDPARVAVIHNGVDVEEYAPDRGVAVVDRLGIDPDRPSVVFVGRITRQKGIVHLLEAAEHIDPAAQLVLIAGAPDTPEIGAEVRTVLARARHRDGGLLWIEEMLDRREVIQVLSHATVFVCPSVYEPFGLVNLEAMACETAGGRQRRRRHPGDRGRWRDRLPGALRRVGGAPRSGGGTALRRGSRRAHQRAGHAARARPGLRRGGPASRRRALQLGIGRGADGGALRRTPRLTCRRHSGRGACVRRGAGLGQSAA